MDWANFAALLVVCIADLVLALAVFFRDPRKPANQAFAAGLLANIVWLTLGFLSDQSAFSQDALLLNRLTIATAMFMGWFFFYFTLVFPTRARHVPWPWLAFMALGFILAIATAFTDLVVAGIRFRADGTDFVPGPLMWLLVAWFAVGMVAIVWVLVTKTLRSKGRERAQLMYVLLGIVIFAVCAVGFGLVLPLLTGSASLTDLNTLSSLVLFAFTAYAMVKHRLMDMRFAVLRAIAYSALLAALAALVVSAAYFARTGFAEQLHLTPDVMYVLSFLVAVVVFQPLRTWLERATDHYFYRRTYDPNRLLSELGEEMIQTPELTELGDLLAGRLRSGMRLTFAAVSLREGDAEDVASAGRDFSTTDVLRLEATCRAGAVTVLDELESTSEVATVMAECGVSLFAPITEEGAALGAIILGEKLSGAMMTAQDVAFIDVLQREAAIAFKNAALYSDLQSTFLGTISALAATVDAKDPYTYGHSHDVTDFSIAIAEEMGLDEAEIRTLRMAAVLHDIGKIGIDGAILRKPGRLTDDERAEMNRHPVIGADIVAPLDFLKDAMPLILFHHERYDGSGYPSGVSGEAIPLGARIIAAADSFNAMTSTRTYRAAMSLDEALAELRANAGTQFDPAVVDAFLRVAARGALVHSDPLMAE
jgi:HD-GYP domain-containing protein (c-di-GMP phosphodiesterase class II)